MFYEGLRLWEARFVVFYEGLRLWGAHLYVFYMSGRLSGGRVSNEAWRSCETGLVRERKTLTCVGGGGGRVGELDLMNVLRILALGGSICHVLQGSEAPGGSGV